MQRFKFLVRTILPGSPSKVPPQVHGIGLAVFKLHFASKHILADKNSTGFGSR